MNAENANRSQDFSSAAHFGYAVVLRRTMLGLKRRQLADLADLSYPYISEIEKGTKEPSAKSLRGLATALGFASVAEMMAWVEEQPPQRATVSTTDQRMSSEQPEAEFVRTSLDFVGLLNDAPMPRPARSRNSNDDLAFAIDRAVRRVLAGVADDLRRELERVVEEEVSRRLGEDGWLL